MWTEPARKSYDARHGVLAVPSPLLQERSLAGGADAYPTRPTHRTKERPRQSRRIRTSGRPAPSLSQAASQEGASQQEVSS